MAQKGSPFPQLAVFDLDHTLWPLDVDTHVSAPFSRAPSGAVTDAGGQRVKLYPDVRRVMRTLRDNGVAVAYASRTHDGPAAEALLRTFLIAEEAGGNASSGSGGAGGGASGGAGAVRTDDASRTTLWDLLDGRRDLFQGYPSWGQAKRKHFAAIQQAIGVANDEIVFYDDAEDNVEVAAAAGIVSVLLDRRGLTIEAFERGLARWRQRREARAAGKGDGGHSATIVM